MSVWRLLLGWVRREIEYLGTVLVAWGSSGTVLAGIDPVAVAVKAVCVELGLPREQLTWSYDLSRTGKLDEVLVLACDRLGIPHPLRTFEDVVDLLHELRNEPHRR